MNQLYILLELAKVGCNSKSCRVSSNQIAERVGCSQQTASRWLKRLSEQGHIEKEAGPSGQTIKLTPKGVKWLRSIEHEINSAFEDVSDKVVLEGEIVSGFGEGSYYIGLDEYQRQFKEKLGFNPYPGTLDVKLDSDSLRYRRRLEMAEGIKVEGFSTEERDYGDVKCFPAKIKEEDAAIVMPYRTSHEERVIEMISEVNFREKYGLEDGELVEVEVEV